MIDVFERPEPDDLPDTPMNLGAPTPEQQALRESAMSKLVAGQPLTEDEAKVLVGM